MSRLKILTRDDPRLRKPAGRVEKITPEIRRLVRDMAKTMYQAPGVGLAATQVGVDKAVAVVDVGEGLIVLINPEIIESGGFETASEGCLSVPGYTGEVRRKAWVRVRAVDIDGREYEMEASGLLARAFQHEIDHLNAVIFTDRADPLTLCRTEGPS